MKMSDITYDWMPIEAQAVTEQPIRQIVGTSQPYRREEEFRSALDRYMAEYQKHRASIRGSKSRIEPSSHWVLC